MRLSLPHADGFDVVASRGRAVAKMQGWGSDCRVMTWLQLNHVMWGG